MNIGILTGGGDCPGLNAVIRSVGKSLISQCGARLIGIEDGFAGLMGEQAHAHALDWKAISGITHRGGTILRTSNSANPLENAATIAQVMHHVRQLELDALVVIGGDGTMTLAHGLAPYGLPVVGVPKTIDNDIIGCERSFGFDTAMNTATEALMRIETTAMSHSRVMIVEVMGRYAGWLALESGIAAAAEIILLPEIDYELEEIIRVCQVREQRQRYTVICIGEGAKPRGGALTIRERTTDSQHAIRLGGVAHALCEQLQPHLRSEVRATVLGHVQRGGSPTPFDRVLATRYGHHAALLVAREQFGQMVTLRAGDMASVPITEVAGRQRVVTPDHELIALGLDIGVSFGVPTAALPTTPASRYRRV